MTDNSDNNEPMYPPDFPHTVSMADVWEHLDEHHRRYICTRLNIAMTHLALMDAMKVWFLMSDDIDFGGRKKFYQTIYDAVKRSRVF